MLTDTEEHVLAMSASGLTCDEIAHLRGTSRQTVKNHRAHIRQKLGVPSMTHAYILRGWLVPPRSHDAPTPAEDSIASRVLAKGVHAIENGWTTADTVTGIMSIVDPHGATLTDD